MESDERRQTNSSWWYKVERAYYIVGWCTNGILFKRQQKRNYKKFDDCDFSFQLESNYASVYTLPVSCCTYKIEEELLPKELKENNCYIYDINDADIQPDIEYIEGYCEGYYKTLFDIRTIDCVSDFKNVPVEQLKELNKTGYAKIVLCNAIYEREPTVENLTKKAYEKYQIGLLSAALEDYIKAISMSNDVGTAYDIIKIAVLVGDFEIAKKYMQQYQDVLPKNNTILKRLYKIISEQTLC